MRSRAGYRERVTTAAFLLFLRAAAGFPQTYTVLYDLWDAMSQDGSAPRGPLTVDESSGSVVLRGTAISGGQSGNGTVFSYAITPGTYAAQSFDNVNGSYAMAGVTVTSAGLFGTSYGSGNNNWGTVWSDASGLQAIYSFPSPDGPNGLGPAGPLLALSDPATFWGTASACAPGFGLVFKITFDSVGGGWVYTVLHTFGAYDGEIPFSGLIQATNGALYGTTKNNVFRIDPDGSNFSSLAPLDATQYHYTLIQASDGYLYGRGSYEIFRLDLSGNNFSTLRTLVGADGYNLGPFGGALLEGGDGLLYGTSERGGANNLGTIFRIAKDGSHYQVLHDFAGPEGQGSSSGLVRDSSGHFYGTASGGGGHGNGVIFQFDPGAWPRVLQLFPTAGPVLVEPGDPVEIVGEFLPASAGLIIGGLPANGIVVLDDQHIQASTPAALTPGTLNDVVVSDPASGAVGVLTEGWFADFLDVPGANPFHGGVESIVRAKITAGCGAGNYCPGSPVTRAQMAVFLLKSEHGPGYAPPPCVGIFSDVPCTTPAFAVDWIEQLSNEGITAGCGQGIYCPDRPVSRKEMATLLLRTEHGAGYAPPGCVGIFGDVACPSLFAPWIEQLYTEGVTAGCSSSPPFYCPDAANTRGQMAVFLERTFGLQLNRP